MGFGWGQGLWRSYPQPIALGLRPDEEVGFVGPFHTDGNEPQIIVLSEEVGNAVVARDGGIIKDISPNVPIEGAVRTFFQDFKVGVRDAGDVFGSGEGLGEIAGDVDAACGVEIEDRLWLGHCGVLSFAMG